MPNYLYNGVELPKLPVVDGLVYAFLDHEGGGYYGLYLTPKLPVVKQLPTGFGDNTGDWLCNVTGGQYWRYKPDVKAWVFDEYIETDEEPIWPFGQGVWSSHTVYNEEGSLYLTASDPVPVTPKKGKLHCSTLTTPTTYQHGGKWEVKTWEGLPKVWGDTVWSDGTNIYCTDPNDAYNHLVLKGDTWEPKTWNGLTSFYSSSIWTDGTNTYYSHRGSQYVLNGDTWEAQTWNGFTEIVGGHVWSDGTNFYCSSYSDQYVLNGNTWEPKTWNGLDNFTGDEVWSDGTNIYCRGYVLNGNTWEPKTWNAFSDLLPPAGQHIWTDGTNIYYSFSSNQYVLIGGNWETKTWEGMDAPRIFTNYMWTDGKYIYVSLDNAQYVLIPASEPEPDEPIYRDNATITLGSGTLYLTEYDGETLPDVETVCVEENRMGYTKGGAALQYTEETTEEKDDLGYVSKIITTKTDVVLKCGLITWNAYTLYKLIDRCTVEIQDGKRVVKIGGKGNENGNKYVVVFHHEDPIGGDLWALIVGRNTAGFTITCTNEAGALIEPEFKALPHDTDGTLVRLIEGSLTE